MGARGWSRSGRGASRPAGGSSRRGPSARGPCGGERRACPGRAGRAGGPRPVFAQDDWFSSLRLKRAWRRRASFMTRGVRRTARLGKVSNTRTNCAAPARDRDDGPRPVDQARDAVGDLAGAQHRPRERGGGIGVVELVLEHRAPDPVRADRRDVDPPDAVAAQVGEGPDAERHRRVLAGRVGNFARRRDEPRERDDVDDVAATGGPHRAQRGEGAVHGSDGVHVEHRPRGGGVLLVDEAGEEDSRVVDPDVEGPAALDDGGGAFGACAGVGHVQLPRPRVRAHRLGCVCSGVAVDVGHADLVPALGEHPGDREAEASARSGYESCRHRRSLCGA